MTTVKNIYDYINSIAPFSTQDDWDNSGHLIGDFRKPVRRCVLALDATKDVCAFAAEMCADLLLTHHPVIFKGLTAVKQDSAVYTLVHGDVAAISAHTNFDLAMGGINDNLATILGLQNTRHSTREPLLVVGELEREMSIDDLAEHVANVLHSGALRYTDTEKVIKTVAVGGGACEEFLDAALADADVFITGDMKYHPMLEAAEEGKPVIAAGHYETENLPFLMLQDKLEVMFPDVEFIAAPYDNPIQSVG
ncbi:MAG: Nif3-like dinuclear metal center hexameric protein [Eubacterium sp.]|nr:Nif3-like dinuclear metal center hexameric protein [Eubacterium sp.]